MNILKTAILDMCRRNKNSFFPAVNVIRQMFPMDWKAFIPELQEVLISMHKDGELEMDQTIDQGILTEDIKIRCLSKPKS
ncbi:hypothetical protein [Algoriphagus machipongonensis]|uniref:Uncharacterized protein n=1 Tax=Algoriphagus machipongonensis TaxID=388413 RepID=A3HSN9_9BACT|nr:hypothetical protein [Algoriphagus machipongonensis]EAZ82857.1 hypothetical protein ALPR1_11590 [Algoriphagus machipongonensis]